MMNPIYIMGHCNTIMIKMCLFITHIYKNRSRGNILNCSGQKSLPFSKGWLFMVRSDPIAVNYTQASKFPSLKNEHLYQIPLDRLSVGTAYDTLSVCSGGSTGVLHIDPQTSTCIIYNLAVQPSCDPTSNGGGAEFPLLESESVRLLYIAWGVPQSLLANILDVQATETIIMCSRVLLLSVCIYLLS